MEMLHTVETIFLQHSNVCDNVIGIARLWMWWLYFSFGVTVFLTKRAAAIALAYF